MSPIRVMYATDENYAEIAGVSIESLCDTNKHINELELYIITDHVSDENKKRLQKTAEKYGRRIAFIEKPDIRKLTGTDLLTLRWSDSAFSRLYVDQVFKDYPEIDKVLYLDCDLLILDDLTPLWNVDISDCIGAGVLECMGNWHKRIIGARPSDHFFNSGVMLINVRKWKEDNIAARCTDFMKRHKGRIEYVDQGVINGELSREIKMIDSPRYNLTALSWDFSYEEMQIYRKPDHGYTKEQWEEAKKNPAIIHFTTSFLSTRPWNEGSETPYTERWREYKGRSEWKNDPLRDMKNKKSHEKKIKAFNSIPRRIAVWAAGILHAYAKPLIFVVINR